MSPPVAVFDRVFANRELAHGHGLRALAWGVGAALCMGVLLIACGLFTSLLIDHGRLDVVLGEDDFPTWTAVTGLPAPALPAAIPPAVPAPEPATPAPESAVEATADAPPAAPASKLASVRVRLDDLGLLPAVWHARNSWYGRPLGWIVRTAPGLRRDLTALGIVLFVGAAAVLLRMQCLGEAARHAVNAARDVGARVRLSLHRQTLRLAAEDVTPATLESARKLFLVEMNDVERGIADSIRTFVVAGPEIIVLALVAVAVDVRMALQWLVPLGLCAYLINQNRRRMDDDRRAHEQGLSDELNQLAARFDGSRLVRSYGLESEEHTAFGDRLNDVVARASLWQPSESRAAVWGSLAACLAIVLFLLFLLSVKVASQRANYELPGVLVFMAAFVLSVRPLASFRRLEQIAQETRSAGARVSEFLAKLPSVSQAVGAKFLQPASRSIHVDQVSVDGPNGKPLLDRIDLKLPALRSFAVVAQNPLESRALLRLLARLMEPKQGRILFDGEDVAWATLESLRAETLSVAADDAPFDATVFDNISAGRLEASAGEVTEASKLAHAHNFVMTLPAGYETQLGPHGVPLDPGQLYRLNLARAALRDPQVLIIEEPVEPLDDDTKSLLDDTYQRLFASRTVFIAPSRLSTLRRVDQIILIWNGRVAAVGPHESLVAESALYRHWEYLRFHEFRREG